MSNHKAMPLEIRDGGGEQRLSIDDPRLIGVDNVVRIGLDRAKLIDEILRISQVRIPVLPPFH